MTEDTGRLSTPLQTVQNLATQLHISYGIRRNTSGSSECGSPGAPWLAQESRDCSSCEIGQAADGTAGWRAQACHKTGAEDTERGGPSGSEEGRSALQSDMPRCCPLQSNGVVRLESS